MKAQLENGENGDRHGFGYAVIDLGTNVAPYVVNNAGMVALAISTGVASVWTNGVPTTCPTNFIVGGGGISADGGKRGQALFRLEKREERWGKTGTGTGGKD